MPTTAATLVVMGLVVGIAAAQPVSPPDPSFADALAAYGRDRATGSRALVLAARRLPGGSLGFAETTFVCDAAIREGDLELASRLASGLRENGDPTRGGVSEIILAWVAIARGRLRSAIAHLDAAGSSTASLYPVAEPAAGLLAVASDDPGGLERFTRALVATRVDPAWREIEPLLDAYARHWRGDALGAARAFTAFAVAHADGRFADDALYAAAQAKRRAGQLDEARADLEALAGDGPKPKGVSRRLLALDGRAIVAEGMRRDRTRGARGLPRRFTDLFDGDGVRLARAALARFPRPTPALAEMPGAAAKVEVEVPAGAPADATTRAVPRALPAAPATRRVPGPPAPTALPPWGIGLGLAIVLLAVLARRRARKPRTS